LALLRLLVMEFVELSLRLTHVSRLAASVFLPLVVEIPIKIGNAAMLNFVDPSLWRVVNGMPELAA
jgi:hypothetical protein